MSLILNKNLFLKMRYNAKKICDGKGSKYVSKYLI